MAEVIGGGATPWYSGWGGDSGGGWLGTAGMGLAGVSDLLGSIQRLQQYEAQQRQFQAQRRIAQTLADPSRLSEYANQLYQPLSGAATDQVSRALNANLGLRGLGGGGGQSNQFVADAFAKIEAQRRGEALQGAIAGLGGAGATLGGAQYPTGLPLGQTAQMLHALAALRAALKPKTAEAAAGGAQTGQPSVGVAGYVPPEGAAWPSGTLADVLRGLYFADAPGMGGPPYGGGEIGSWQPGRGLE